MHNRAWKYWVLASILAAGSRAAEEEAKPRAFNSAVPFDVYAVVGGEPQLVGSSPSVQLLKSPPCQ